MQRKAYDNAIQMMSLAKNGAYCHSEACGAVAWLRNIEPTNLDAVGSSHCINSHFFLKKGEVKKNPILTCQFRVL